ncbi:hypothetical protein ACVWZZ_007651 [Bradyrhizobium sp. LM6.10]
MTANIPLWTRSGSELCAGAPAAFLNTATWTAIKEMAAAAVIQADDADFERETNTWRSRLPRLQHFSFAWGVVQTAEAKLWRKVCGVTRFVISAISAATWQARVSWRVVIGLVGFWPGNSQPCCRLF